MVVRKVGAQTLKVDRKVDGAILMNAKNKWEGCKLSKLTSIFIFRFNDFNVSGCIEHLMLPCNKFCFINFSHKGAEKGG
jgi:hypothetical protein